MQKKLIALAIAGLSGAAFAQSNVTIYGVMDAGFESTSATGASPTALGAQANDMSGRNRITSNSSYVGFKGAESLGNGLTAVFQVENQIAADGNGGGAINNTFSSTQNAWASRDTYMGIAGGFGTVAIGYLSTPTRTLAASFDVMPGATGAGASTLSLIGRINTGAVLNPKDANGSTTNNFGGTTATGSGSTAANSVGYLTRENAIAYITPDFSGFNAVIAYVPNEGKFGNPNNAGGPTRNPNGWNLALNYANGPLKVSYTYLEITDAGVLSGVTAGTVSILNGQEKHKSHMLGLGYTFGGATTVNFIWDSFKGTLGASSAAVAAGVLTGDVTAKRNAWMLGVKHVMGAHEIAAQYSRANDTDVGGVAAATVLALGPDGATGSYGNSGAKMFALRYAYNFSKRTSVYALYSQINNDTAGNYDFGTGGAVSGATANGAARINAGADPRTLGIGMRHSF